MQVAEQLTVFFMFAGCLKTLVIVIFFTIRGL
jgi:hypothetical protein